MEGLTKKGLKSEISFNTLWRLALSWQISSFHDESHEKLFVDSDYHKRETKETKISALDYYDVILVFC